LSLSSIHATKPFQFDNTPDATVSPPIVGTGTFGFTGDPGDGTFALTSLTSPTFNFTVGGANFGDADIQTPLATIDIIISTVGLNRNVTFDSLEGGPFGGSLDFINGGGTGLSFEPNGGQLYFSGASFGTFQGVVPVPFEFSPVMGFAVLGGLFAGSKLVKSMKEKKEVKA
jgi:hypothetical protein